MWLQQETIHLRKQYNTDETGLNSKGLPKKSLASKKEECASGLNMSKEQVTVLSCSNVCRTHKLPLMVIGKSKGLQKPKHKIFPSVL